MVVLMAKQKRCIGMVLVLCGMGVLVVFIKNKRWLSVLNVGGGEGGCGRQMGLGWPDRDCGLDLVCE